MTTPRVLYNQRYKPLGTKPRMSANRVIQIHEDELQPALVDMLIDMLEDQTIGRDIRLTVLKEIRKNLG